MVALGNAPWDFLCNSVFPKIPQGFAYNLRVLWQAIPGISFVLHLIKLEGSALLMEWEHHFELRLHVLAQINV